MEDHTILFERSPPLLKEFLVQNLQICRPPDLISYNTFLKIDVTLPGYNKMNSVMRQFKLICKKYLIAYLIDYVINNSIL
jgi:hypothetical protein